LIQLARADRSLTVLFALLLKVLHGILVLFLKGVLGIIN
jgi:hypothetical protein